MCSRRLTAATPVSPYRNTVPDTTATMGTDVDKALPVWPTGVAPAHPTIPEVWPTEFVLCGPFVFSADVNIVRVTVVAKVLVTRRGARCGFSFFDVWVVWWVPVFGVTRWVY